MLFMVTLSVYLIATLNAVTQTICWSIIIIIFFFFFFFASAGASSAYLTVSEVFPLEICAQAIALFYAIGIGAAAGVIESLFGVDAERQSLEHVSRPLSAMEVAAA